MDVNSVFDDARSLLQGGQTSTAMGLGNGVLQTAFNQAYTEMWQAMEQLQTPRVRREFYFVVPADTSYVDPASAGITDMGEPELMYERGSLTSVQISTTDTSSPIIVATVGAHGLTTNAEVTIGQVAGTQKPCGRWFITVLTPTTFSLNGSISDAAGSGGYATTSTERFQDHPMGWLRELQDFTPGARLGSCLWEGGVFQFNGASSAAQIRVTYLANATPPTTPTADFGVPEGATFVATRMASIMARSRGLYAYADALKLDALGPQGQADGSGGQLATFTNIYVNGMQRNQYRQPAYVVDSWAYWNNLWGNTAFGGGF